LVAFLFNASEGVTRILLKNLQARWQWSVRLYKLVWLRSDEEGAVDAGARVVMHMGIHRVATIHRVVTIYRGEVSSSHCTQRGTRGRCADWSKV